MAHLIQSADRLRSLDRERERHLAEYRKLVDEGASVARIALEEVERIDGERDSVRRQIDEGEAVLGEWEGPPDVDAALDFYGELVELVQGRIKQASGADDLRRALGQVLAGLWVGVEDNRLEADFQLRVTDEADTPSNGLRQVLARSLGDQRVKLPWKGIADSGQPFDLDSVLMTPELDGMLRESDDPEGLLAEIVAEQRRSGKPGSSPSSRVGCRQARFRCRRWPSRSSPRRSGADASPSPRPSPWGRRPAHVGPGQEGGAMSPN